MDFLRRLLGGPTDQSKEATKPSATRTGAPIEISPPGSPKNGTPTNAGVSITQADSDGKSPADVNEAAMIDPTPIISGSGLYGATRPLPPLEPYASKPGKHLIYGMSSDIGVVRTNNQDSMFAYFATSSSAENHPDFGLFIVADGMGGHHDGELASAVAARVISEYVLQNFYLKMLNTTKDPSERPVLSEVLSEAVQKANSTVSDEIPEGGTTVTSVAILSEMAFVAHVGDSRAYLVTADGIEQITRDHSLVQRLIELDQLTPEEAALHPQRNVLYRAIGQSDNLEIDAVSRRLSPGSRLLICSDGLWNQVSESNLQQIIAASKTPQEACDHLIRVANDRGGPDNITAILIQLPG